MMLLLSLVQQRWINGADILLLGINLIEISAIAFLFAALLAPLEALGWWAGWYGDEIDTSRPIDTAGKSAAKGPQVSRYVIYIDGTSLASSHSSPKVEQFLQQLSRQLPEEIQLIRGIMPYSVLNKPLTEDRLLSFFWRLAAHLKLSKRGVIGGLVGLTVNLRNLLIVLVSADKRYGPIYNQGVAQVIYDRLIQEGYQRDSHVPITLIGYGGGGQIAVGVAQFLKQVLTAPIEVISLGGIISGNANALVLERLYHLVGDRDWVERLGILLFPRRWKIFFLSYWNRAKQRGKIQPISLGPIAHGGVNGPFSTRQRFPDGRRYRQQALDRVLDILQGTLPPVAQHPKPHQGNNYDRSKQAAFNHPSYYPLHQSVSAEYYRAIAPWIGRLILPLPQQRRMVQGILFEVHHADEAHQQLVGQVVNLRWSRDLQVQTYVQAVTRDVHFSEEAEYTSRQGLIHPDRLNHWRQVDPLESLAGARPNDDMVVMLQGLVVVEQESQRMGEIGKEIGASPRPSSLSPPPSLPDTSIPSTSLYITHEPIQITGRYYGLVKFVQSIADSGDPPELFRVVHFNRASRQFDGLEEVVRLPQIVPNREGIAMSTSRGLEKSPLNETGWYIYGAKNAEGCFVVQAIAPRALLRLQPDQVIADPKAGFDYVKKQSWANLAEQKGQTTSVLISPECSSQQTALADWQEGDRALLIHVYGGIGGNKPEPAAQGPVYFGHFAYGSAQIVRDPIADELRFEIQYYQVYTHNGDGIISGTIHWSRYMGDRQFGWLGARPISDILIKLDAFTKTYTFNGTVRSGLDRMIRELETMMARYRIGDGTGGTYVGPANNCAQDSNQALYATIRRIKNNIETDAAFFQDWAVHHPEQARRLSQLLRVGKRLKQELLPLGTARADWQKNSETLGTNLEDHPLETIARGLISWRTMLPRVASDTVVKQFLQQGASVWVLRTNQVGGADPDIEPIAPITF